MSKRLVLYVVLLNAFLAAASAQEVVTGLQSNSRFINNNRKFLIRKSISADTLALPFFDDFSGHSIFPDDSKWSDSKVLINNTYSDKQITSGVATFDALDSVGRLYTEAVSSGFKADELTSLPVNLKYTPSDNIYLSFFYQAGGLSDPPELRDSLTLEFFAPLEDKWYSVWKAEGSEDTRMKPAIINIQKNIFLQKGFRFRFVNYASLSQNMSDPSMVGNCDIWNIDYVLLNKDRNPADTVFADVAYTLPIRSLLKTYEAMPWRQFRQVYLQEMGSTLPVHYRNNDIITRNVTRNFNIYDVYKKTEVHSFTAGATNIGPLTSVDYDANLVYTYGSTAKDSAVFRVTASLKTDNFDPKSNDTLIYYQVFKNYFAYDDGTAEAGYGVNGLGSRNAMVACRFNSVVPDTIRAVRICFNDSYNESNKREFDIMIWGNDNGKPGDALYSEEQVMVDQGDIINGFFNYKLPEGVPVNNIFYVGWKQLSETFLNVGYDINTLQSGRQFYWINGEWRQSQEPGTLMIRPVVGTPLLVTSVKKPEVIKTDFKIWPNPAKEYLNIEQGDLKLFEDAYISILDLNGREIMKVPYNQRIDISSLHEGMYILVINTKGVPVAYNKILKIR